MESCEGKSVEAVYPEIYAVPDTGSTAIPAAPSTADPPTYVLDVSDPSLILIFRKNASRLPPSCRLTAPVVSGKSIELVIPATYMEVESNRYRSSGLAEGHTPAASANIRAKRYCRPGIIQA